MALTDAQRRLLKAATAVAKDLESDGARELVPLIGELTVCERLDLTWKPSEGYDALSDASRFQIKTRKSWSTPGINPAGRLGRFGRKKGYNFDVALYAELDEAFNLSSLWRMGFGEVRALEEKESGGRALHVGTFRKNATQIDHL